MIINYSKQKQRHNLILGSFFTIVGTVLIFDEPSNLPRYYPLLFGLAQFWLYFLKGRHPYLKVEKDELTVYKLRAKKVNLAEVWRVRKFAGEITLFTPETRLNINSRVIDKSSLQELKNFIDTINPTAEDNPSRKVVLTNS